MITTHVPSFVRSFAGQIIHRGLGGALFIALLLLAASATQAVNVVYTQLHDFGFTNLMAAEPRGALLKASDGKLYGTSWQGGTTEQGAIYRVNADGTGFTVIFSFPGGPGREPSAGLIEGSDGALYGVTAYVAFRVGKDGSNYTNLHNFGNSGDGAFPLGRLVEGDGGVLFGTTSGGGTGGGAGDGTVFRLNKDGTGYAVMHSFSSGDGDPKAPQSGLLKASDGFLYGQAWSGGPNASGGLFKIGQDGSGYTNLHQFGSFPGDGRLPFSDLIEGTNGALYGTTLRGGDDDVGVVFMINKDGTGYTNIHSFPPTGGAGAWYPMVGLLLASDGKLYSLTEDGFSITNGYIFRLNQDGTDYEEFNSFPSSSHPAAALRNGLVEGTPGVLVGTSQQGGKANAGTLFSVNLDGSGYTVRNQFSHTGGDGAAPTVTRLQEGSDGKLYGVAHGGGDFDAGTVYRLNKDGSGYTNLHAFNPKAGEGRDPYGWLTEASNGKLYATTTGGGTSNQGTVFQINKDGSGFAVIHSFGATAEDGRQPYAGLLLASDGKLYGTTATGGTNSAGTIFQLNIDGTGYGTLYTLQTSDGKQPTAGLIEGNDGKLYGTALQGGVNNAGTIFRLNKNGTGFEKLRDFVAATGGFPYAALREGTDGLLYGATTDLSSTNYGTLFRMNKDGTQFQKLKQFGLPGTDGLQPIGQLVEGLDGRWYGTTIGGGVTNLGGVAFRINKDGSGFVKLRSFNPDNGDGNYVVSSLFMGSDGRLYGTTLQGPQPVNLGTVFALQVSEELDFGDAPAPYPTLLANNGARHDASGPTLGATRDIDANGQPSAGATGDGSDEDGVSNFQNIAPGSAVASVTVNASATAQLDAWIDWNKDGDWNDAGEQIAANLTVNAGDNLVSFNVPPDALPGTTFARFRLSTAGALAPTGLSYDGEVEDYMVTVAAPPNCITPPAGLIGWWRAEDNANDSINANNGALQNGATYAAGKVGRAFSFDGDNDIVVVPDAPNLNPTAQVTLEAWAYPTSDTAGAIDVVMVMVNKENGPVQFEMGRRNTSSSCSIPTGNLAIFIGGISGLPDDCSGWVDGQAYIPLNAWSHVVLTYDGTAVRTYLNGSLTRTIAASGTIPTTTGAVRIGGRNGPFSHWAGQLDEIGIYDRALTTPEVQSLYDAGSYGKCPLPCTPPPAGMVAWWSGDNTASDRVGANHGTLKNGATYADGMVRTAFSLDGGDDYVEVPDSPAWAFGANAFTIDLWANFSSVSGSRVLLSSDTGPGEVNKWVFWLDGGQLRFHVNGPANVNPGVPFSPQLNRWYHLAVTHSAGTLTFYIDGADAGSVSLSTPVPDANAPLTIGSAEGGYFFAGRLDEIEIFNRALSAGELQDIYEARTAGKCVPAPALFYSPTSLVFGAQAEGTTSAVQVVTLTNSGNAQLNISNITINGDFVFTTDCGTALAPGAGCAIHVGFAPTDEGARLGTLTLIHDAPGNPGVVTLHGTGVPPVCVTAPAGLVNWWRAESNALDNVGVSHGTLQNGAGFAPGRVGQAFHFDSANEYVSLPGDPGRNFGTNNFAIEFWVNSSVSGRRMQPFTSHINYGVTNLDFDFNDPDPVNGSPVGLWVFWNGGGSKNLTAGAPGAYTDGRWHHIALTRSQTTISLFIDGVSVDSDIITDSMDLSTNTIIGAMDPGVNFWDGRVDEVSIYNHALTPADVTAIYNARGGGKCVFQSNPPVATNFTVSGAAEDTSVNFTLNGVDVDGNPLTFIILTQPLHGALSGSGSNLSYNPVGNFNGLDSFTYVVSDGVYTSAVATVSIPVAAINDPRPAIFTPGTNFLAGIQPSGVVAAKFDAGVTFDLAVANAGANTVTLLRGIGTGVFTNWTNFAVGQHPSAIATADFNRDGKADFATANRNDSSITVYKLNGAAGVLSTNEVFIPGGNAQPVAIVAADFNRDLKIDLATANWGSSNITIFMNQVATNFSATNHYAVGQHPSAIAAANLNKDTKPDLAVAVSGEDKIAVLTGWGSGTFSNPVFYAVGDFPAALAIADFNGDKKLDIAVACAGDSSIHVLTNAGNGTFALKSITAIGYGTPSALLAADFSRDGKLDLAVTLADVDAVVVLPGNGDGTFSYFWSDPTIFFPTGTNPVAMATATFNKDLYADLVVANAGGNDVTVLLNNYLPVAFKQSVVAREDSPKNITIIGTYGPLDYIIVNPPTNGSFIATNGVMLNTTNPPTLTYLARPETNGNDRFDFVVTDGVKTSKVARVTIKILPVNDQPSFTLSTNEVTVNEDAVATNFHAFATNVVRGPINEIKQSVKYVLTQNSSNLFSVQPNINAAGKLGFTPRKNLFGDALITARLLDGGGTNNGGTNLSELHTFTIHIQSVNDTPVMANVLGRTTTTNIPAQFNLAVGDLETAAGSLTLSFGSSDTALVPVASIVQTANTGTNRIVTVTPATGLKGKSVLTFTVSDGTNAASRSASITVK